MKAVRVGAILSFAIFLVASLSSAAFTQSTNLESLTPDQLKSLVIKFQRSGCYGNCPQYQLAIYGDGRVEYQGIKDVKLVGSGKGTIEAADVRSILTAFAKANFFTVGDNVSEEKCNCGYCTDLPTVVTEITIGGTKHTVEHYLGCGCATKELRELESVIDRLVKSDQWTGDVSKSGPMGMTCFNRGKSN